MATSGKYVDYSFVNHVIWKFGKPADLWLSEQLTIGRLIKKFKLKPIDREFLPYGADTQFMPVEVNVSARAKKFPRLPPFPGGIRVPHTHYRGEVYMLDQRQWQEFSNMVMKDIKVKLASAKSVNFQQVMELTEAAGGLY